MGLNGLRQDAPLVESVTKADGEFKRMTEGPEGRFSPIELDGLIEVRQGIRLLESVTNAESEVVETAGVKIMAEGQFCKATRYSTLSVMLY
jgi:hypothetical protein